MLADSVESVRSILETMWEMGQLILVQQFVHEARGRDLRLLVVDGQVIGAMRRSAHGDEFRANLHRGGNATAIRPTPMARRLAIEATAALGLTVAGVDLIEATRGPLVLEVNPSPGFEGLDRACRIDIADHIIEHASSKAAPLRAVG